MQKTQVQFSLRPATVDDVASLLFIEQQSQPAPWTEQHFRSELEKPFSRVLVATDDETDSIISGFIVFWLMDECQVLNIAVALDYRGLGLGKMMLRQAIAEGIRNGMKRVVLDVRKSNVPAVSLYQSIGFTVTSIRKSFYSNGEDAYSMTLYLDDDAIKF